MGKVEPETEVYRKRRPAKQRRLWCRGKVGVQHQPQWRRDSPHCLIFACTACNKQLDYVWSYPWLPTHPSRTRYLQVCSETGL